jgi:hypothetical protein
VLLVVISLPLLAGHLGIPLSHLWPAKAANTPAPSAPAQPAGGSLVTRTTEHFILICKPQDGGASTMAQELEQVYGQFYSEFRRAGFSLHQPLDKQTWVCLANNGDLARYARQADQLELSQPLESYYSARTNRVAFLTAAPAPASSAAPAAGHDPDSRTLPSGTPGRDSGPAKVFLDAWADQGDVANCDCPCAASAGSLTRLSHEVAHQLAFNSGLQKRGVMYPIWVSEGLATNFEADSSGQMTLAKANLARSRCLGQLHQDSDLMTLDELAVATGLPLGDSSANAQTYAQAWGLFRFLLECHPGQLKSYLSMLAEMAPGKRTEEMRLAEFVQAFGPIAKLQPQWDDFLNHLATIAPAASAKGN